ncbi:hypothetical protein HX878_20530 [Pseudomonas veronii]|nr:hypothetical protein [Pseudomonas veronii]
MRMTGEQFDALVKLMRGSPTSKANRAARRVLIDGVAQVAAARELGLSAPSVSAAVKRYTAADKLIRGAYTGQL